MAEKGKEPTERERREIEREEQRQSKENTESRPWRANERQSVVEEDEQRKAASQHFCFAKSLQ